MALLRIKIFVEQVLLLGKILLIQLISLFLIIIQTSKLCSLQL